MIKNKVYTTLMAMFERFATLRPILIISVYPLRPTVGAGTVKRRDLNRCIRESRCDFCKWIHKISAMTIFALGLPVIILLDMIKFAHMRRFLRRGRSRRRNGMNTYTRSDTDWALFGNRTWRKNQMFDGVKWSRWRSKK